MEIWGTTTYEHLPIVDGVRVVQRVDDPGDGLRLEEDGEVFLDLRVP